MEFLFEVGKGEVAAQHEIERTFGKVVAQIRPQEVDCLAEIGPQNILIVDSIEGLVAPVAGKLAQEAFRIAGPPGTFEDDRVGVAGDDLEVDPRSVRLDHEPPDDGEGVGLLAGGTAGAPGFRSPTD